MALDLAKIEQIGRRIKFEIMFPHISCLALEMQDCAKQKVRNRRSETYNSAKFASWSFWEIHAEIHSHLFFGKG